MTRLFWSRGSHTSSHRSGTRQTPERQKLLIDSFSLNRCGARRRYKATRLNEWHLSKYCTLQRRNAHSILYYSFFFFVCACVRACVRERTMRSDEPVGAAHRPRSPATDDPSSAQRHRWWSTAAAAEGEEISSTLSVQTPLNECHCEELLSSNNNVGVSGGAAIR